MRNMAISATLPRGRVEPHEFRSEKSVLPHLALARANRDDWHASRSQTQIQRRNGPSERLLDAGQCRICICREFRKCLLSLCCGSIVPLHVTLECSDAVVQLEWVDQRLIVKAREAWLVELVQFRVQLSIELSRSEERRVGKEWR